jgi:hypothetical protein
MMTPFDNNNSHETNVIDVADVDNVGVGVDPEEQVEYAIAKDSDDEVNTNKKGGGRGPSYTKTEDLLVCKAFISASEDSQVGTSQKGKAFAAKMLKTYHELLVEQECCEAQRLSGQGITTIRATVYYRRNRMAIYVTRFQYFAYCRYRCANNFICSFILMV